jgi:hypothetical protein
MPPPFSSALLTPVIMEQWIQSGIAQMGDLSLANLV